MAGVEIVRIRLGDGGRLSAEWTGGAAWADLALGCRLSEGVHRAERWTAGAGATEAGGTYQATCGPLRLRLQLRARSADLELGVAIGLPPATALHEVSLAGRMSLGERRTAWVLGNGYHSWDAASWLPADAGPGEPVESWWACGMAGDDGAGLAASALAATTCATRFSYHRSRLELAWRQPEAPNPPPPLADFPGGGEWGSETAVITAAADVRRALAGLATGSGVARAAEAPRGWLSWYHHGIWIDRERMLAHARLLASEPFRRLGYRWLVLDDGWQQAYGDWVPNAKFPGGLRALCEAVAEDRLGVGVWTAPFLVSASSDLARQAPEEWFVHIPETGQRAVDPRHFVLGPMHVLDAGRRAVREHLRELYSGFYAEGVRYFKVDFLYAGGYAGVAALRAGLEAIREGAQDAYLLACGAPLLVVAGLADGCRIGPDTATPWFDFDRDQPSPVLFGDEVRAVARNAAARHFLDGWFQLDPDVALAGGSLTLEQGRQLVTLAALMGGPFFASDDLLGLAPERLALLTNPEVLELVGGEPAVPDWEPAGDGRPPTHWRRGRLLAVFNWTLEPQTVPVRAPGARGARDLWAGTPLPDLRDGTPILVPASGVRLLRLSLA